MVSYRTGKLLVLAHQGNDKPEDTSSAVAEKLAKVTAREQNRVELFCLPLLISQSVQVLFLREGGSAGALTRQPHANLRRSLK